MGKTIELSGFNKLEPAEAIKTFLEKRTGKGTVVAIEVKLSTSGRGAFARVQFTSNNNADYIISLTNQTLWYGSRYLKAWMKTIDIVKPKTFVNSMEHIRLHFGCQVATDDFQVLWTSTYTVKFGLGLSKLYFFLSHDSVDYKLELSNDNIWQTELRRPLNSTSKFLLIQLLGAPRIFKKCKGTALNYYKEIPDDQWIRTTDFTQSSCIGQSSHLCLEFPQKSKVPYFREKLAFYEETDGEFKLKSGSIFSKNLDLVPIVGPREELELPYHIVFKVCALVQQGCIPGPAVDDNFYQLLDPKKIDIGWIEHVLEKLYHLKSCCYEPVSWINSEYMKHVLSVKFPKAAPVIALDVGLAYVRRIQITPCKVYCSGPEVNMSNRVLRHYADDIENFLRVSFVDEELDKLYSMVLSPRVTSGIDDGKTDVYHRILSTLKNGIVIGNKKFEFLAFSSSQLRDNSAWLFASRKGLTAADIRRWMGDFQKIRNVAKYAARLGQSFSSSTETLSVPRNERKVIDDIEIVRDGIPYIFSDGIGKISADFAREVAIKCGLKSSTPSAFQIRYAGYKGVVAVDPTSSVKLSLRKSMCKYESDNTKLDVLSWTKYQPCFLNRQIITLLSTLGVKDQVFLRKQRGAINQLNAILKDPIKAQEALELMSPGENTNVLKEMLICGYKPDAEPFLSMMLQMFRESKLLELRIKSRIFLPRGRSMMGCLDESGTLEYGQVFVQYSSAGRRPFYDDSFCMSNKSVSYRQRTIIGKVAVAKNPCLHPGDVRILEAVDVPVLHHMVDCIVFPQKGKRPHPNECSGSDLDGDNYFVCWDPDLVPSKSVEPMDYNSAPIKLLDHDVTIEEVEEYFTDFIVNDTLGVISVAHTVFADREPEMAMSDPCLELAELSSVAVDFPKTGITAEIPQHLRIKEYPDFMEKPDKPMYESVRVIGKLFREVMRDISLTTSSYKSFTKEVAKQSYDRDMEVDGFEMYIDDAIEYKSMYDFKLGNLMESYGMETEAEILCGGFMKNSRYFDRKRDGEALSLAVKTLRKEARNWFKTKNNDDNNYAKASAWYHITYHPDYWGCCIGGMDRDHFLSFPWCIYDTLIQIKKNKSDKRRAATQMSLLQQQFMDGLTLS